MLRGPSLSLQPLSFTSFHSLYEVNPDLGIVRNGLQRCSL